ncbi:MAG TPA: Crp/Fnr family transcriptional regulator [Mycobacteriales bacterium]|nr:Crp/Fnr family transcriptional regulator [Mycobacteriales bacterium]
MAEQVPVDQLAEVSMLSELPRDVLEQVVAASRHRSYPRGQVMFSAGDPSDTLVIVLSGRIKVLLRSADGGVLTLSVVGAGGLIGELSMIDGGSRSADAEVLEAVEVLLVPAAVVADLQQRYPAVTAAMLRSVAAGFRRLTDAVADLVFLDLPRRVAKQLLDQPRDADGVVDLGLSQSELSQQVAGTRQSVNQALRGFERRGWIYLRGRLVVLRDPVALANFAGEEVSAT